MVISALDTSSMYRSTEPILSIVTTIPHRWPLFLLTRFLLLTLKSLDYIKVVITKIFVLCVQCIIGCLFLYRNKLYRRGAEWSLKKIRVSQNFFQISQVSQCFWLVQNISQHHFCLKSFWVSILVSQSKTLIKKCWLQRERCYFFPFCKVSHLPSPTPYR